MGPIVRAELRSAWSAWLSVVIAFIVTSFAIVLPLLALAAIGDTIETGLVPAQEQPALQFVPAWNLALVLLAGLSVISAVTGLVVQARRGSLARLALAGATPRQVARIVLAQVAVVAAFGALVGAVLALLALPGAVRELLGDRGVDGAVAVVRPDLTQAALGVVIFIAWACLATLRQARIAAAVPPVEALRTAPGAEVRRHQVGRWVGAVILTLAMVGLAVSTIALAPELGTDGADAVLQAAVICMLLTCAILSLSAPMSIGRLTRAWTALVPSRSASWTIARASIVAKGERLSRTVTPIMMAFGLLVGLGVLVASLEVLLAEMGHPGIEQTTTASILVLVGLVLLVSIAGGVSVVLMMSRQREAELALAGVIGATRSQQVLVTVLEGAIITVTATLLGVVMAAVGLIVFVAGLGALGLAAPVIVPWGVLGGVVLVGASVTIAVTTLPVLPSLGRSARVVVAQLAAE